MPSRFPGMDPYLEGPHWSSFHAQLCVKIARHLMPNLGARYVALEEERLVTATFDDIGITTRSIRKERFPMHLVEIRAVKGLELVTVIEVLSPANKTGEGRREYLHKRRRILRSDVNLIEIDLLRSGERVPMASPLPESDYFVLVHRASTRPVAGVWPIGLADRLPSVPVPILPPDPDIGLDLRQAFTGAFDSAGYNRIVNYSRNLQPPLNPEQIAWSQDLLNGTA